MLVTKEIDGTPTAIDTTNRHGLAGAGFGAGIGLLLGLIAPPLVASLAVGAATGALVAKLADHSLKSGLRRVVGEALEAGTGVVIALYRDASQSSVERTLAGSATKSIVTFAESTIASLEKEVAEVMSTVSTVITAEPEPQSIP